MRHFAPVSGLALIGMIVLFTAAALAQHSDNLLLNGSAEQGKGNLPSVWFAASVPAETLKMERTRSNRHSGKYSLKIANEHKYAQPVSNNWAQEISAVPAGKTVRLEAWLRTKDADAVNVCVQCWDVQAQNMLGYASTPVFRGDQEWILARSGPVIVPPETASVIVRAALTGLGEAWFDDLSLTVVSGQATGVMSEKTSAEKGGEIAAAEKGENASEEEQEDLAKLAGGKITKILPVAKDCMVLAYMPDWDYGNVDNIAVANNGGGVRTLLDWNPKDVGALKDSLKGRRVLLALYSRETMTKPKPGPIAVYEINDRWPERTSWKKQPEYSEKPVAECVFRPGKGWKLFDVTRLIRTQSQSPGKGRGVMLRFKKEDFAPDDWSGYQFVSREGLGEWKDRRPRLLIVQPPAKIEKSKDQ